MEIINGKINLTTPCNSDCHCSGFSYTPVCWEETGDTFFNPCVASCNAYSKENKVQTFIKLFTSHFLMSRLHFSFITNASVHERLREQVC